MLISVTKEELEILQTIFPELPANDVRYDAKVFTSFRDKIVKVKYAEPVTVTPKTPTKPKKVKK